MDFKIEVIAENDGLLRRIILDPSYIKPDNTISSFAFKPGKRDVDGLSVDLERLTTPDVAIIDRTKYRLARFEASVPLSLGLACLHAPRCDNPAHSLIQGNFTTSIRRQLASAATLVL
ncbi:MAG: hypothetical protein V1799_14305 [bacterium]